jgi:small subunit ribosomal protein S9
MPIKKADTIKAKAAKAEKPKIEEEAKAEKIIAVEPEANNDILDVDNLVFDTKKKYFEAVGRRKNSTARVRLFTQNKKGITVNGKSYQDYFKMESLQKVIISPLEKLKCQEKFGFEIIVKGGACQARQELLDMLFQELLCL